MGVLPLRLPADRHPDILALSAEDWVEIDAPQESLRPHGSVAVRIRRADGRIDAFEAMAAIETTLELDILRVGGIMSLMIEGAGGSGLHLGNDMREPRA